MRKRIYISLHVFPPIAGRATVINVDPAECQTGRPGPDHVDEAELTRPNHGW
jgi:hypothetical protein